MSTENDNDWYRDREFVKWIERFDRFFSLAGKDTEVRPEDTDKK